MTEAAGKMIAAVFIVYAVAACTPPATVIPQPAMPMDAASMEIRPNTSLTWTDIVPPGFSPGMKIAVLHGDPNATGDYTIRLSFPEGYQFPVHWHPGGEHLTVLTGTFLLNMGNSADVSAERAYEAGDFLYIPGRMSHYGGARGPTVLTGTLLLNMGNSGDVSAERAYDAGDFLYIPGRMSHYGGARGPTVIQLHGVGPFSINLGTP